MVTTARLATPPIRMVPLDRITLDPDLCPRSEPHTAEAVEDLAAAIDGGATVPDGVIFHTPDDRYLLAEGFLRHPAYELAGRGSMPCEVREGDRRAAALHAAAANKVPGVTRRTRKDVRRCVAIVLRECWGWTDLRVAAWVGTTDKTVAGVRRDLLGRSEIPNVSSREDSMGRQQPAAKPRTTAPAVRVVEVRAADPDAERERRVADLCGQLAAALDALARIDGGRPTDRVGWVEAARLVEAARALVWGDRPGAPPSATVVGSVVRRPLADGRPYPQTLAAQQFNEKHIRLLDERLEDLAGESVLMLAGRPLSPAEQFDLVLLVQRTLLREVYG